MLSPRRKSSYGSVPIGMFILLLFAAYMPPFLPSLSLSLCYPTSPHIRSLIHTHSDHLHYYMLQIMRTSIVSDEFMIATLKNMEAVLTDIMKYGDKVQGEGRRVEEVTCTIEGESNRKTMVKTEGLGKGIINQGNVIHL
jgi:hypothetical protein